MEIVTNKKWRLQPIKGDTGQTYLGRCGQEKIFIKRNANPFFVTLSKEGLAPKLIWSKRMKNGDVMMAQEWLSGRVLTSHDMQIEAVIDILHQLHCSDSLTLMLYRIEGEEMEPIDFLQNYRQNLPQTLRNDAFLNSIFLTLEDTIPPFDHFKICACHGDVNHRNWMYDSSDEKQLYLIDWDSTILSDPFCDIGPVLCRYINGDCWDEWLQHYGVAATDEVLAKVRWYGQIQQLIQIKKRYELGDMAATHREIERLSEIRQKLQRRQKCE